MDLSRVEWKKVETANGLNKFLMKIVMVFLP